MQATTRNFQGHAKAPYALGGDMWIAALMLDCQSPIDVGAVTTS